jgi:RNA polymerase sigma-70 factor (ECF subfamily)
MIARGFQHLALAKNAPHLTSYHLEAGIASVHAAAGSWGATDWVVLLSYYDGLMEVAPSPVAQINRAVALSMVQGPDAALDDLRGLETQKPVARYLPYHMTVGELELRRGARAAAREAFGRALALPMSGPERTLVEAKLRQASDA